MAIPWAGLITLTLILGAAATVGATIRASRKRARLRATGLPESAMVWRVSRALPGRLTLERSVVGGPRGGGWINRGPVDLVLTDRQLIAATWHGRVLVIDREHPGRVSNTGPSRLVLEGEHPSGETRVRLEILAEDAQGWVHDVQKLGG